ncbi:MAG: GtrA family protein [Eubacteriales bacterium]|nr:GtrA family protein [Eubacteriales bacterium]
MKELINKNKGIILYLIFGGLTTLLGIIVYFICSHRLKLSTATSSIISWILATTFAFFTNKIFVFDSKKFSLEILLKEATSFFSFRIFSGLLDLIIMVVGVDFLKYNDFLMKMFASIIVVVTNYIASKFFIFKKK